MNVENPNQTMQHDAVCLTQAVADRIEEFARTSEAGAYYAPQPLHKPREGGAEAALIRLFEISEPERALLALSLTVALNPKLEEQIAGFQGWPWRPLPTEALTRALFGLPSGAIWRPTSALARWHLVKPVVETSGAAPGFAIDPRITDWLMGTASLDDGLVGLCSLPVPDFPAPEWTLEPARASILAMMSETEDPLRVDVYGAEGSGKASYATALVEAMGAGVILVNGNGLPEPEIEVLYTRLQRFARLTSRVPVWQTPPQRWPGNHLPSAPLQFLLLSGQEAPAAGRAARLELRQPEFTAARRKKLWCKLTGKVDAPPLALAGALPGELRAMAPLARVNGAIAKTIEGKARSALETIGQVRRPQITWDDLVLPDTIVSSLRGLVDETRARVELMQDPEFRRLFARDAAPTALFSGPSGVGKTMAADCIAAELGLPLLVVDVSRIASRYIGETAKALSRVFAEAQRFGCILFFDEADATFSRRTDVKDSQDRHANADTGHLLQLIEAYEGCVILSTNRRSDIDEAFLRRMRHVLEFPKPGVTERTHLWTKLAGHLFSGQEVADMKLEISTCAKRLEFTPAQIKAALLSARYAGLAKDLPLSFDMLLAGCQRELIKEGRNLPPDLLSHLQNPKQSEEDTRHVA